MRSSSKGTLYAVLGAVGLGALLISTGADRLPSKGSSPLSEMRLPGGGRLYAKGVRGSANAERARLRAVFEATQNNWAQADRFLDRAARSGMAASIVTNDRATMALAGRHRA